MAARRDAAEQIDFALRRHFSASFTEAERAVLVAVIREWDAAHPDLDRSTRLNGWLALAREALVVASPAPMLAAAR
jgi:hypothetical protein